jgi:hypothetical protein
MANNVPTMLCTATAVEAALGNKEACTVCQDLPTNALTYLEKKKNPGRDYHSSSSSSSPSNPKF